VNDTGSTHLSRFRIDSIVVEPERNRLIRGETEIPLEPRVMEVLCVLANAYGRVVSRDDLVEKVWQGPHGADESLSRAISVLRKAIRETGYSSPSIETVPKRGYRLLLKPTFSDAMSEPIYEGSPASSSPAGRTAKKSYKFYLFAAALLSLVAAVLLAPILLKPAQKTSDVQSSNAARTLAILTYETSATNPDVVELARLIPRSLRNTLSPMHGLRLIASASSLSPNLSSLPPSNIGETLGAAYLLRGNVSTEADQTVVTSELIEAASGRIVWTHRSQGETTNPDIFETEILDDFLPFLINELGPENVEPPDYKTPRDPVVHMLLLKTRDAYFEAFEARLQGNKEKTANETQQALENLDKVFQRDPQNAEALMQLYFLDFSGLITSDYFNKFEMFANGARRGGYITAALRSDPNNIDAIVGLANENTANNTRWDESEVLYKRAIALDANHPTARVWYAYWLTTVGRCVEAIEQADVAMELDPETAWVQLLGPRTRACAGRIEEADALYKKNVSADPKNIHLIHEVFLFELFQQNLNGLKDLSAFLTDEVWRSERPDGAEQILTHLEAAEKALSGDTSKTQSLIAEELAQLSSGAEIFGYPGWYANSFYALAVEAAFTGLPDTCVNILTQAVQLGSLYIPPTLPGGPFEFTKAVRDDPAYKALWRSDPRLVELVERRIDARNKGLMLDENNHQGASDERP